jgi:hypothetical protein
MAVKHRVGIKKQEIITIVEFVEDKRHFMPADMPVSSRFLMADDIIVSMPFAIAAVDPFTPRKILKGSMHIL